MENISELVLAFIEESYGVEEFAMEDVCSHFEAHGYDADEIHDSMVAWEDKGVLVSTSDGYLKIAE